MAFVHYLEASLFIGVKYGRETLSLTSEGLGETRPIDVVPIEVLVHIYGHQIF